jgi:hypothetical protein
MWLNTCTVLDMHEAVSNLDLALKHLDRPLLTSDFLTAKDVISGLHKMDLVYYL